MEASPDEGAQDYRSLTLWSQTREALTPSPHGGLDIEGHMATLRPGAD